MAKTKPDKLESSATSPPWKVRSDVRLSVRNLTRDTLIANSLEAAASGPKRSKGLLGRNGIEKGGGLWIIPCEAVHTFFMKFPIDLIYIDRNYRVKKVRSNVGPWRISGCLTAHSVIELPSGSVRESKTERGDLLEISEINTRPTSR